MIRHFLISRSDTHSHVFSIIIKKQLIQIERNKIKLIAHNNLPSRVVFSPIQIILFFNLHFSLTS